MTFRATRRRFLHVLLLTSGAGLLGACSQSTPPSPTAAPAAAPKPTEPPKPAAVSATAPPAAPTQVPATGAPAVKPTTAAPAAAQSAEAVGKDHPTIQALYDAAKKEAKVSWWDQHAQDQAQKFVDAFQQQFPGVQVEFFYGTQDQAKTRAVQEARAGQVSADFIDTGQNYTDFLKAGLLSDKTDFTDILTLAGVGKEFIKSGTYSPEFTVYGGCAYNPTLVKPEELPDTLDGFSDPKWKGKLAIEQRLRPYVYGTPWLGGEDAVVDMLKRLKSNNPRPINGDIQANALLVAGEYSVLVGAYLQRMIEMKDKPWGFVDMKEVWTVEPGPGYIVPDKAPHPNAGRLFLWWFMSPEGLALTDSIRFKGNPAPGTGTGPSRYLEEHRTTVRFSGREYEDNYDKYLRKYLDAIGMPVA
jgi:iron(III) transport system substrate-binding protein